MNLKIFAVALGLASVGVAAEPDTEGPPDRLVGEVLERSPDLRAAKLRWEALAKRPEIVGALPDPMLSYGHWLRSVETRVGALDNRIALSQKFPAWGKRKLAASKAEKEALVAMWEYQTLARRLILRTRLAWFDRLRVKETRHVLSEELNVLRSLERTAIARYESGKVQQQDVIKVQLAATGITNHLHGLRQQEQTALAQLNALLNRQPDSSVAVSGPWPEDLLPEQSALIDLAIQYRQELKAAGVTVERDEIASQLARKQRLPDITVGVDYTQVSGARFGRPPDGGKDAVMGFFSINIPLWRGKLKAQEEEAELRLEASRQSQENLASQVAADVFDAWQRTAVAGDQIQLYDTGLIPQAERSLGAALTSYQAAKGNFLDVLDAQRALLTLRLGLIMSQWDRARGLSQLERAIGVDLDKLKTLNSSEK